MAAGRPTACSRTRATASASLPAAARIRPAARRTASKRWRYVNGPHLLALVRAGAAFEKGMLVERPAVTRPAAVVTLLAGPVQAGQRRQAHRPGAHRQPDDDPGGDEAGAEPDLAAAGGEPSYCQ